MNFGCVLMAAGLSSRFGENKLLYRLNGYSLIERTMRAIPASLFVRAVAVVSADEVQAVAEAAGYAILRNPSPEAGQGGSIALGVGAMEGMDAVLFCVGDQPYLARESVQRLLDAYTPGYIHTLSWRGTRGSPVLFPAKMLEELASLAPHETGRVLMERHPDRVRLVEACSPLDLHDIDTKADLPFLLGPNE